MRHKNLLLLFFGIIGLFFFSSCERPLITRGGKEGITFSLQGISENPSSMDLFTKNKASSKPTQGQVANQVYKQQIIDNNGLDFDLLFAESNLLETPIKSIASTSPMQSTIKYIVVLYETNDAGEATTYFDQAQSSANSEIIINAYRNKQYRWFAYSFNNESELSLFNPENPNLNINSSIVKPGQDFLYSTGIIRTSKNPNAENRIQITFQRKLSAIRIELDARGVFSSILSANLDFTKSSSNTGFNNGVFSIINGKFTSTTPVPNFSIAQWTNAIADTVPINWVKYIDFLTIPSGGTITLSGTLKNLQIRSQSVNSEAPHTDYFLNRSYNSAPFKIPTFVPVTGKKYTFKIRLIESAINFAGARWARGNLTFFKDDLENQYRFWYNNNFVNDKAGGMMNFIERDYFDSSPPGRLPQSPATTWDPCAMVYPKGTWRLPTVNEFYSLTGYRYAYNRSRINQPRDNGWYLSWKNVTSLGPPRYANRNLNFVAAGYRNQSNSLENFNYQAGNTSFFFPKHGDVGYYRSSDSSRYMVMKYRGNNITARLSIGIERYTDGRGANVRCVRK